MDSEHNSNLCDDSDCKICRSVENNLEDSSSRTEKNVPGISSNNHGSHQYQGNESNLSQNLHFLSNRPSSTEFTSSKNCQPAAEISNTLPTSQHLCYQSSEKKSNVLHDKEIPISGTLFSSNQGAHLQPNEPLGTEFRSSDNKITQCKKQPIQIGGLHPLNVEAPEFVPNPNRQLFTERQQVPDSKCHAIQESQVQTKLRELSVNQDLGPSPQQFAASNMNRIQRLDSASQQQSRNVHMSQSSHLVCYQPHQNTVNQASCLVRHRSFGNGFGNNRVPNIGGYFWYSLGTSRIQDLHLPSFQQSVRRSNYIQSSHPHELPQYQFRFRSSHFQRPPAYESRESCIRHSLPRRLQQYNSDTKAVKVYSKNDSTIDEQHYSLNVVLKKSKVNQDVCSKQPDESRARETQGFHQVSQVLKVSKGTECQFPYSLPQQQSNQRSRAVQSVEEALSASQDNSSEIEFYSKHRLLGRFLQTSAILYGSSGQAQAPEHFDLSMLQRPYSNSSENINLLVYGPTSWTTRLIQTYSRGLQLSFDSPYGHALTRNVTRCGIDTSVSVFQVDDLNQSVWFMRSRYLSAKSTVMFVFNLTDQDVGDFIKIVRRRVSRNIPITFVGCRHNIAGNKVIRSLKKGYKLKTKYDLSAFLVCRAYSEEEVDDVFYNAMDVSRLVSR